MKIVKIFSVLLMVGTVHISSSIALGCNVCHSKNPRMAKMHRELGYKDCFVCHGLEKRRSPEERKAQMARDERCIRCHRRQG